MTDVDAKAHDYTEYVSRHLVGMCWYQGPVDSNGEFTRKPDYQCASGFLLQVYDTLCLITAGHVLVDHDRDTKKGLIGQHYSLFDFWSPRSISVERIPFNFTDAPCWFDYSPQRGLDFAVIALPDNTLTLLQQTIVPFTHERWIHQAHVSFDFYALLGIPSCDATQKTSQEGGRNSIVTFPDSRLIRVEAHPNPPNDLLETEFPQFIGRIHPNETIPDVAGTSGGPIFGFRCNDKGQLHYWPVAIQSRWRAQSRTVIGTSIPIVARSIHKWIAGFAQQKCKGPT